MVTTFYRDLRAARAAETLVRDVLASHTSGIKYELVGDEREYFHKGDIKATNADGSVFFIEVKDDSRIWETRNVLCEDAVFYEERQNMEPGNMHSDYEVYCVVSQHERKLYFIDFKKLQANYKKGFYKEMAHPEQTSYTYLCQLWQIKKWGAYLGAIKY